MICVRDATVRHCHTPLTQFGLLDATVAHIAVVGGTSSTLGFHFSFMYGYFFSDLFYSFWFCFV